MAIKDANKIRYFLYDILCKNPERDFTSTELADLYNKEVKEKVVNPYHISTLMNNLICLEKVLLVKVSTYRYNKNFCCYEQRHNSEVSKEVFNIIKNSTKPLNSTEVYKKYCEKNHSKKLNIISIISSLRKNGFIHKINNSFPSTFIANEIDYLTPEERLESIYKKLDSYDFNDFIKKHYTQEKISEEIGVPKFYLYRYLKDKKIKWESQKKIKVKIVETGELFNSISACARYLKVSKQCCSFAIQSNGTVKNFHIIKEEI